MKLITNLIFEPKGKYDSTLAYNIKDTVMSADGRRVYFALQDVPAGTPLSNKAYWILMLDVSDVQSGDSEGGAVLSVNGQTGDVTLSAADVGALPADTEIPTVPANVSAFANDAGYLIGVPEEYVTDEELESKGYLTEHQDLSDYAKKTEIPDVSAFITRAVDDLANYYTKSQTYTREEIDQKVSAIPKFSIEVVSALPSTGISATTIYLVPGGADDNLYTEYINVNGTWEILGSQRVDLTGYATQSWTLEQLAGYQPKGNYALKSELPTVPTNVSAFTNDAGYLTEHQDISGKLDADKLPEAIDDALAQAKASGEFDGADGEDGGYYTPSVDTAGNLSWTPSKDDMLNLTGANIKGPKGDSGASVSILSVTESTADGGNNVIAFTDGKTVTIKNGSKGSTGDPGPAGADGAKGDKGDTGETGPAGNDGYTPQRGVDYYTESDKAEWSEYIASELAKRGQLKPEFANDISECTDTSKLYVLPDGYIYAYVKTTITTEGGTKPNFTNLLETGDAFAKPGLRFSQSNSAWKTYDGGTGYVIKIPKGNVTLRVKNYYAYNYNYLYAGTTEDSFPNSISDAATLAALAKQNELITITFTNNSNDYVTFASKNGYVEIITVNEEITYTTTEGGTETVYAWKNTGHAFVPADYEDRIVDAENRLDDAESNILALQEKVGNVSASANATTAFSVPAYCPVPQLPADGSEGSDFNCNTVTTQDAYDYMDALCGKYTQYITKQTMGKDASGVFDHNRYILSKAYWRAWQNENYPRMFAWQNGSTVIYSVSVSPRVGDPMYSTPYIDMVYSTVTAVNSAAKVASTRTVNELVFTRYAAGDVEPTIAYTKPPRYPGDFATATVYNSSFGTLTTVAIVGDDHIVGADGIKYIRYPFEDRRKDETKPLSVFILSNEHGLNGDALIPSFAVMRMAKDLCKNTENPFLKWLKENCMITMIPVGNPWGYAKYLDNNGSGYYNSNGININRNYDTPGWSTSDTNYGDTDTFGAYPGSEIETQHIMNTIQLCKAAVGISMHGLGLPEEYKDMSDNGYFIYQGQGFSSARVHKIAETLYSSYALGPGTSVDYAQHYEMCGKSPAYIQYAGAVGGLTETICWEAGTNNEYTSIAMEQAYTQLLLFLQTWCEEALSKV